VTPGRSRTEERSRSTRRGAFESSTRDVVGGHDDESRPLRDDRHDAAEHSGVAYLGVFRRVTSPRKVPPVVSRVP